MEIDVNFQDVLLEIMEERGLTRNQITEAAGLNRAYFSTLKTNGNLKVSTAIRICEAVGIGFRELLYILDCRLRMYDRKLISLLDSCKEVNSQHIGDVTNQMLLEAVRSTYSRENGAPFLDIHKDTGVTMLTLINTAIVYRYPLVILYDIMLYQRHRDGNVVYNFSALSEKACNPIVTSDTSEE